MHRKIQFQNRFTDLSLEINHKDSYISFDKNLFSPFKFEIHVTSFLISTRHSYMEEMAHPAILLACLLDAKDIPGSNLSPAPFGGGGVLPWGGHQQ